MVGKGRKKLIGKGGVRVDGRKPGDLRPIKIKVGLLERADGSAYVELGKNKILAAVYGPREVYPRHLSLHSRALIRCRYHMASFSVEERKSPAPSRREVEISKVIRDALEPVIFTEFYPRTVIDIFIEVLQADGGTRGTGIIAASLALADAGIPLRDLVAACAAGKVDGQLVLDLNDVEDKEGTADLPVAYAPQMEAVTLLQMDGALTRDEFERALKLAVDGCKQIHALLKEALRGRYLAVGGVVEAGVKKGKGVES